MSPLIHLSPAVFTTCRSCRYDLIVAMNRHAAVSRVLENLLQVYNWNFLFLDIFNLHIYVFPLFLYLTRSRERIVKKIESARSSPGVLLERHIDGAFKPNGQNGRKARRGSLRKYLFVRDIPRYILSAVNGGASKQWRGARCNRFSKAKGIREQCGRNLACSMTKHGLSPMGTLRLHVFLRGRRTCVFSRLQAALYGLGET